MNYEFQSRKQLPHVRVIIGPFGEGDSLSTLKFGKLRQGCYILQVHPPETIPSNSLFCQEKLFLFMSSLPDLEGEAQGSQSHEV